jgi:hypothetical protein
MTKTQPHSEPPSEQVVGAEIASEENRNVSKASDLEEISDVLNRSNEKQVAGHQSSTDQTEVENEQVNFVQNTTDSQVAPESSGKVDENTIGTQKKGESVKSSLKAVIQPPPLRQPIVWDSNVLLVGGLLPGQSGVSEAYERNCEYYMNHPIVTLAPSVVNLLLSLSSSPSHPLSVPAHDNN